MDEEKSSEKEIDSNSKLDAQNSSVSDQITSLKPKESSTESILSTINEECNKISSNEKENGMDSDHESSSASKKDEDAQENSTNDSSKDLNEVNIAENGQASQPSSEHDHSESPNPLACTNSNDGVADNSNPAVDMSVYSKDKVAEEENAEGSESRDAETPELKTSEAKEINEEAESSKNVESSKDEEASSKEDEEASSKEDEGASSKEDDKNEITKEKLDSGSNSSISENSCSNSKPESDKNSNDGKNGTGKIKIKLRSFASLCESDNSKDKTDDLNKPHMHSNSNFEVSGVSVGDIVQHSNIVESDESGVMHLKISNVVGGEDCITGISMEEGGDSLCPIQISSITSLIEPLSPDDTRVDKNASNNVDESTNAVEIAEVESLTDKSFPETDDISKNKDLSNDLNSQEDKSDTIINVFRSPLVVVNSCYQCKQREVCDFRMVWREKSGNNVHFLCSSKCKNNTLSNLPESAVVQKPRLYFERICGMCGKDTSALPKASVLNWQTREFCNKLCLADHIGEVARLCYYCKTSVRVLYMVKYCVRFGSDVHQFCCNNCLETYKTTIKVCSFCQKNLTFVNKVVSPSNKEYCSNKCLKRAQRRDIGQINYKEENDCTVCSKKLINKFEYLNNGTSTFLCSSPCLNVFKYVTKVKTVNCCLCARLLSAEDTCNYFFNGRQLRVFCSESCFSVFVISSRKIVTCHYCKVKKYNFDMIATSLGEDSQDLFCCSVCCLNFVESQKQSKSMTNQVASSVTSVGKSDSSFTAGTQTTPMVDSSSVAPSATPILKNCNMCSKLEPAQFHMVMSDSTLRSFCSYVCATRYKCTFGFQVSGGIQPQNQTKEVLPAPEKPKVVVKDNLIAEPQPTTIKTPIPVHTLPTVPTKAGPKMDLKDAKSLVRLFCPPHLSNKSTSCRPQQNTKGVQCKPHQWHKGCQTDEESKTLLPIPIPVYVPTPMMMYSAPTPVPLVIPVPVPIPVFIPTGEKTTKELEDKIKAILEEFPSDPDEAKKFLMERLDERKNSKRKLDDLEDDAVAKEERTENNFDACESELEIIARIELSLPKYYLNSEDGASGEEKSSENNKRKLDTINDSPPKRRKLDNDEAAPEEESEEMEESLDLLLGLSVWHAWVQRKIGEQLEESELLQEDLSLMTSEDLSQSLILFLEEVSAQTSQFEADTIFYILLGLQKYLFEKGSTHCIFLEVNFDKFTSSFDEIVQKFFQVAAKPDTKCIKGTRVSEEMLWEARQLGAHTPHVLINTLFYFNTKIFKLKTPEDHFNLTFNQIFKEGKRAANDPDGSPSLTMYLKYSQDKALNKTGKEVLPLLMYENKENPLRCPVKLYEFYLSKCPHSIRTQKDAYYVYPERSCLPDSPVWYSSDSLEIKTIEKMLHRILLVREVQESLFASDV